MGSRICAAQRQARVSKDGRMAKSKSASAQKELSALHNRLAEQGPCERGSSPGERKDVRTSGRKQGLATHSRAAMRKQSASRPSIQNWLEGAPAMEARMRTSIGLLREDTPCCRYHHTPLRPHIEPAPMEQYTGQLFYKPTRVVWHCPRRNARG